MKRKLDIWTGGVLLAGVLTAMAGAQSLGEYARQQRAKKPATPAGAKVYTNDNLPTSGGLSQVTPASSAATSASATASEAEEKKEDRGKAEAEWRAKFKDQKDKIVLLEHDLDASEREYKLRTAMFYSDPTTVARSQQQPKQWAEEGLKHEQEIKEKQKDLAAERQRLEDMKEELRKAGLPNSWAD